MFQFRTFLFKYFPEHTLHFLLYLKLLGYIKTTANLVVHIPTLGWAEINGKMDHKPTPAEPDIPFDKGFKPFDLPLQPIGLLNSLLIHNT